MSIEMLQKELAALPALERRRLQAFLIALEDSQNADHRRRMTEKIDTPVEKFASIEELDQRLKTGPGCTE